MDIHMPTVDGETASRMIKSTENVNSQTPVVAVTAYEHSTKMTSVFDDMLVKPVLVDAVRQRLKYFCAA